MATVDSLVSLGAISTN